ncbi:HAD family hydrolase [Roseimaritima sediminicola]|uniref:HAD family hydrolase n=1 Tax=Roseimaritima sediminicola TaxID=2662066 RepID=UPI0012984138|nr:HAD family hydrolase [Roseimaritima sediminicola]
MRILLFDIDGTLIHAAGAGRRALLAALQGAFEVPEPRCEINFSGQTDGYIFTQALLQNRLPATAENLRRLIDHYLQILPHWLEQCSGVVLPGVVSLLGRLQQVPGIHLSCMTGNLASAARLKLQHFGLWDGYFDGPHLFTGDDCQQRDQMARAAAARLAASFEGIELDLWVIGDTPRDVRCARAMGARVLACCTGQHSRDEMAACQPDHLFDDLSDVSTIADILCGDRHRRQPAPLVVTP